MWCKRPSKSEKTAFYMRKWWCAILGLNQPSVAGRSRRRRREPDAFLGPVWDHTQCALVNDLRVSERPSTATRRPSTGGDLPKRVTATYWGSSSRFFDATFVGPGRKR